LHIISCYHHYGCKRPYGVNITKQPERILEPTEMANNVLAETQGIINLNRLLVGEVINKPSIVTNDTRPAIS
jgi:hypothetical protein